MTRRLMLAFGVLCGCARPVRMPAAEVVEVGPLRADYRRYSGADLCDAERSWLAEELRAMNALLGAFLQRTEVSRTSVPSPEQIALLQEAAEALPDVVEVHGINAALAAQCDLRSEPRIRQAISEARQLCVEARERLRLAAHIVAWGMARQNQSRWHAARSRREQEATLSVCDLARPRPLVIAYGAEDCGGRLEWVFCDGARVTRLLDGELEHLPSGSSRKRGPRPVDYLRAISAFPAEQLDACPSVPELVLGDPAEGKTGEAEPKAAQR